MAYCPAQAEACGYKSQGPTLPFTGLFTVKPAAAGISSQVKNDFFQ
jgi:hypothetical protein